MDHKVSAFFCLLLAFFVGGAVGQGLFCNVCQSFRSDVVGICSDPKDYSSINCTSLLPRAKFCVVLNGNYTEVKDKNMSYQAVEGRRSKGKSIEEKAQLFWTGIRRSCQFDLDRYEIFEPLQPGCRSVNLTRNNYLAFDYFHFDGQICLCDEDNCNIGEAGKMRAKDSRGNTANARSTAFFSTLLLVVVASVVGAV